MHNQDYEYSRQLQQVHHYLEINNYFKAQMEIQEMLQQYPEDGHLHYLLSCCLFGAEEFEAAIEECSIAAENDYSIVLCNYLLAKIYLEQERYKKSEQLFLEALSMEPNDADILASYGYLMLKTGFKDKAVKLINEALRIEPENCIALRYKYYLQIAARKRAAYMETLEKIMQNSDSELQKLISIAVQQLIEKKSRAAKETLRQAYLMDPTNMELLQLLKDVEQMSSIFYAPARFIDRIGGGAVLWIAVMALIFVLNTIGMEKAAGITAFAYIGLCVYTWILYFIQKIKEKRENR